MTTDYINISSIETHLNKILSKQVCKHCYATTLPATLSEDNSAYVVIDCANSINDFNAYAKGIVNIYLYAKPIGNGLKNVAELSKLEKSFNKLLQEDAFDTEHYSVARELIYSNTDYDNTYNMHFIIKAIQIKII